MGEKKHLHAFACFSTFFSSHTLFDQCESCMWVSVKLCMCVLILVAATRSYSRSTGALHTPDAFGAAGEGWVHLLLRTSPTHFALIFVGSVFIFVQCPHIFCTFSACLFVCLFFCPSASVEVLHSAPGCRPFQWNRMFPPIELPIYNHAAHFSFSALPLVCRDFLLSFILFTLCPLSAPHLQCHLTSHPIYLQGWIMATVARVGWMSECGW